MLRQINNHAHSITDIKEQNKTRSASTCGLSAKIRQPLLAGEIKAAGFGYLSLFGSYRSCFQLSSHLLLSCLQAPKRTLFTTATLWARDQLHYQKTINFQTTFQGSKKPLPRPPKHNENTTRNP